MCVCAVYTVAYYVQVSVQNQWFVTASYIRRQRKKWTLVLKFKHWHKC